VSPGIPPLLELLGRADHDAVRSQVLRLPRGRSYRPGADVFAVWVQTGVVVTGCRTGDGREVIEDILVPGDVVLPSLPSAGPVDAARPSLPMLRATVESLVVQYATPEVSDLADLRPDIAMAYLSELAGALRHRTERVSDLALYNSLTRIARTYLTLAARIQPEPGGSGGWLVHGLSQAELARFVGVTRETFNRGNRSLVDRGIVEIEPGRLRVVEYDALRRIACLARPHADAAA
jgi:CRP-like cAMP-binding protein